jgi:hypothetical protein
MQAHPYKADPRIVPPVALAMAAGLMLLALEGLTPRGFLMLLLLFPFFYLGAEILARKITVDSSGLTVSKLLLTVHLDWSEIQSMDVIKTGSKLFVILQAEQERPILISNTISPFKELAESIMERLPADRITPAARDMFTDFPSTTGPIIQAWIVCTVLTGIVVGKILGYG